MNEERYVGMTILHPDWTPADDTMHWISYDAGAWYIGENLFLTRVNVVARPDHPLTPQQVDEIRDAEFTKMRHQGVSIIPRRRPGY